MNTGAALAELVIAYEGLSAQNTAALAARYAPEARFKDPFNEVQGRAAIERIFIHMFEQVDAPRFCVTGQFPGDGAAMLTWEFHLRFRGEAQARVIRGASHLRFDAQGLVTDHRDYWDAAEELYAQIPLLGALMRWLRRRLATPQH
ncbi:nuclear transport factor 2 family protein [Niveibacterium sp. 24ML]|uniref:nuclear transport factor 2 family protein n=1 Tax=Niveibacterium sp. 24ML TaxID=2985512 RepID=UPI00226FFBB0|nr:nuclear transport factor 2 family protein [Niveibacterium sp. 24ML]MCX9154912.1 nuclear transport factor 2 family protein [Niveibacterium sp. 24ML]